SPTVANPPRSWVGRRSGTKRTKFSWTPERNPSGWFWGRGQGIRDTARAQGRAGAGGHTSALRRASGSAGALWRARPSEVPAGYALQSRAPGAGGGAGGAGAVRPVRGLAP